MTLLTRNPEEWEALARRAPHTSDARLLRRAQALVSLAEGEAVQEVAARLRVTRQAVSKGVTCFQQRHARDRAARLAPGKHTGRPRTVHGLMEPLMAAVLERDPRELGYRSTVWTAPLRRPYVGEGHQLEVAWPRVRLAIARLRLRWKRPRHALSWRPARWRQAKGGSSAAWQGGSGRSS